MGWVWEGEVINQSALDNLAKSLQREYENQGRYDARVESRQVELPDNRVGIEVQVAEGAIARIGQIQFFGNAAFERDDLTDEMELKERGLDFLYKIRSLQPAKVAWGC